MTTNIEHLQVVLEAAQRLLSAREDQMITADEWEALANAVDQCSAMSEPPAHGDDEPSSATRPPS
jgi:hypothetical protein